MVKTATAMYPDERQVRGFGEVDAEDERRRGLAGTLGVAVFA